MVKFLHFSPVNIRIKQEVCVLGNSIFAIGRLEFVSLAIVPDLIVETNTLLVKSVAEYRGRLALDPRQKTA